MSDGGMLAVSKQLRSLGIDIVRFNFLYREKHIGRPDAMPVLKQCVDAVTVYAREKVNPVRLLIGGRSMGGRAASMLVADRAVCDRLLLLAYPLHPPGQPAKRRVEHLPRITVPVLCVNGTRDPFCNPALMTETLAGLGSNWRMLWLEGADHSFHVLKSSGKTDADVLTDVADAATAWLA